MKLFDKMFRRKENLEGNKLRPIVEPANDSQLAKQSKEEENRNFCASTTASESEQETSVEVENEKTGNLVFINSFRF